MKLRNSKLSVLYFLILSFFIFGCENKSSFSKNTLTIENTFFTNNFDNARFTPVKSVEVYEDGNIQQKSELQTISFNIRLSNIVTGIEQSTHDLITVSIQPGQRGSLNIEDFEFEQNAKNDLNVEIPLFQSIAPRSTDRYAFLNNKDTSKSFWCRMYNKKPRFCVGSFNISNSVHATYKLRFKYMQYWPEVNEFLSNYIKSRVRA